MRARDDLHLGQHVAEVLGVHAGRPPRCMRRVRDVVRQRQRRAIDHVAHDRTPIASERGKVGADSLRREPRVDVVRDEQLPA